MTTTPPTQQRGNAQRLILLVAMACVLALGLYLRINSTLRRPLEHDEISSTNMYTYVGYIDTIGQLRAERPHDVKRLAGSLVRPFLGWNPNDHMIHELALSVGVFLLGSSEAAVRASALAGSLAAALALMLWAARRTGSIPIAAFCGAALALEPYFIHYGQAARGYSVTAFLLILQVLLVDDAENGKRGLLRLWLLILVGFALFLNLSTLVVLWLAPLYVCMLWRMLTAGGAKQGTWKERLQSEPFGWWLFQSFAVGALVIFFLLIHLALVVKAQGDYGVKFPTAGGALHRMGGVFTYLFPWQWMLLPVVGLVGWVCMLRSRYWLAGPIVGSFLMMVLYIGATKTVPYDRTFGIWIVFAVMGCAWLWKSSGRMAWLPAVAAVVFLITAFVFRRPFGVIIDYQDAAQEITREIKAAGATPADTLAIIPFNAFEETRFYLPEDSGYLSLAGTLPQTISVYLPCKPVDAAHDGFRSTYYHRAAVEFLYYMLPDAWRKAATWRKPDVSVVRLNAAVTQGAGGIRAGVPQIVVWQAANKYFDVERFCTERLINNKNLPEMKFVKDYYSRTPALFFFTDGDTGPIQTVLAELQSTAPGSVTVLTPQQGG